LILIALPAIARQPVSLAPQEGLLLEKLARHRVVQAPIIIMASAPVIDILGIEKKLIDKIACSTLNSYCTACNSSSTCTACSSSRYALGSTCATSCPSGTYINSGVCTCKKLMIENEFIIIIISLFDVK